jgi:hypothetical protein
MKKGFLKKKAPTAAPKPTPKADDGVYQARLQEYTDKKVAQHCASYTSQLALVKPVPPVITHHMSKCNDAIPALEHKTNNISQLKYDFTLAKTKTITITIRAVSPNTAAIIGFIYGDGSGTTFVPKMVSIGGAHTSTQGEVHKNVILWQQFIKVWENFTDMLTPVEKMTVERMVKKKLSFHADFYKPKGCSIGQRRLNEFIDNDRLAIKFFVCSWLFDYKYIVDKLNSKNLSESYVSLIKECDYTDIWNSINQVQYHDFMRVCMEAFSAGEVIPKGSHWHPVGAVQKIRPVSYAEITRVDDINMDLWREIYVQSLCSELVINFVSPSFSCLGNWFFIPSAHAQLFDSPVIKEKYAQSDIANRIADQLKRADDYNANATGPVADMVNRVHEAISIADKEIRLTSDAVCIISEWGGRTITNAYAVSDTPNANDNIIRTFSDPVYFAKHAFEILYACACMNNIGIVHGDMSADKVVFQTQLKTYDHPTRKEIFKNPLCVFEHGDTYLFPEDGSHFMIISLASALLEATPQINTDKGINFVERYISDQLPRACKQLKHSLGDKFNEANFITLYNTEPHKAFLASAAADPYHFFNTLLIAIAESPRKMPAESVKLCEDIRNRALELFIQPTGESPSTVIIKEFFAPYRIGPDYPVPEDALIFNVFRRDLPLTWNLGDYEAWGPLINREDEFKLYHEIFHVERPDKKVWDNFMQVDETARLNEIAKKYVDTQRGIIDPIPFS